MNSRCFVLITGAVLLFTFFWANHSLSRLNKISTYDPINDHIKKYNNTPKIVLAWTTFFRDSMEQTRSFKGCPQSHCIIVDDKSFITHADAVLFHMTRQDFAYWNAILFSENIPPIRHPNQRYIFLNHESPMRQTEYLIGQLKKRPHFFNWTMTYRLDSDVLATYYDPMHLPNKNLPKLNWTEIWESKKKNNEIIWFSSHCPTKSKREDYVKELNKHISIDTFGVCGNLICERSKPGCFEKISGYKFHLAFENAVCKDYITEKLWHRYHFPTIPIVLKRSIYKKHFPGDAFIAVDDFQTPEKLAHYLKYLSSNVTAYVEYFAWRDRKSYFEINDTTSSTDWFHKARGLCSLCQMLHQNLPHKSYSDLAHWWVDDSQCDNQFISDMIK